MEPRDGSVHITRPDSVPKLVPGARHTTFGGQRARANGQKVIYVTEAAVFELRSEGLALIEIVMRGYEMPQQTTLPVKLVVRGASSS